MKKKHTHKHMYADVNDGSGYVAAGPINTEIEHGEIAVNGYFRNPSLFIKDQNGDVRQFCDKSYYDPLMGIGIPELLYSTMQNPTNPVYLFGSQYSSQNNRYHNVEVLLKYPAASGTWNIEIGGEHGLETIIASTTEKEIVDADLFLKVVRNSDNNKWAVILSGKLTYSGGATDLGTFFCKTDLHLGYDLFLNLPNISGSYPRVFKTKTGATQFLETPIMRS